MFEFALLSYNGKLPGQEGYDKAKDDLLRGFNYGGTFVPDWLKGKVKSANELSAYDFLTSPVTGLRPGQANPPSMAMLTRISEKPSDWYHLPPVFIWQQGEWVWELVEDLQFDPSVLPKNLQELIKEALVNFKDKDKTPASLYNYYVTSGEGTSGNYLYRVFELPESQCGRVTPHHPMNWPKEKPKTSSFLWGDDDEKPKQLTTPTPKPQGTGLPFGVKIRCVGCGHWFKSDDLPNHSKLCPREEDQDFAVMCAPECGCTTLDQVATRKPGFPRAIVVPPAEPTPVAEKPLNAMTKKELMAKAEAHNYTMPSGWNKARMIQELEEVLTKP